ncbi:MAG: hemolysin III family protein [Eubacteriales bacterium]|nr:hemolysin III family protein [Clostridiales bacterium]MDD6341238.1 hemolysin III family protein [Eubacteriales bacterium]MDD7393721.1 hemolysin III family protein [Eubacteriales bacterium]MDY3759901.1 hemolysin III family protein [Eubacteriales bacterium]
MKRTKLKDRQLPDYTKGEEIFNMVTHIVGGALGIAYLVLCVIYAATHSDPYAVVSSAIYGASVVVLFSVSSIYHGLHPSKGKKVMQVLDHCVIYFMIAGTYTPITLCALRENSPALGWTVFGVVWGMSAFAALLNAIDLKKYKVFSIISYLAIGWCVVFTVKPVYESIGFEGFLWLLTGGVLYTVGAVLYMLGHKKRYIHSVFHIFIDLASVCHFICILFYVL